MALRPLQANGNLTLSIDVLDTQAASFKGGEVVMLTSTVVPGDLAAADATNDGYIYTNKRPVATRTLTNGARMLFLADDGITGYGTLLGTVVGGVAGQQMGAALGPSSLTGSGKLSCWQSPGTYAISLDAVDTTASTGFVPENAALVPGAPIYATSNGVLTPNSAAAFENVRLGSFVEFADSGSLVNTPNYLVQSLNSPSGTGALNRGFKYVVIHWVGSVG